MALATERAFGRVATDVSEAKYFSNPPHQIPPAAIHSGFARCCRHGLLLHMPMPMQRIAGHIPPTDANRSCCPASESCDREMRMHAAQKGETCK